MNAGAVDEIHLSREGYGLEMKLGELTGLNKQNLPDVLH